MGSYNFNCLCNDKQCSLCGFDHINHEKQNDCTYRPVVHTNKIKKYCKVVTREFPLKHSNAKLLADEQDQLTLVVKYQYSNNENKVDSVQLRVRDQLSNNTIWVDLSVQDLTQIIETCASVNNDIIKDDEVFLF